MVLRGVAPVCSHTLLTHLHCLQGSIYNILMSWCITLTCSSAAGLLCSPSQASHCTVIMLADQHLLSRGLGLEGNRPEANAHACASQPLITAFLQQLLYSNACIARLASEPPCA